MTLSIMPLTHAFSLDRLRINMEYVCTVMNEHSSAKETVKHLLQSELCNHKEVLFKS